MALEIGNVGLRILTGVMSSLLVTAVAAHAGEKAPRVQVTTLNQKIQASGATWIAKDSWLLHASNSELQHLMGLDRTVSTDVEFMNAKHRANAVGLPRVLDWRNKDGKNWISPLINQANCGSCVAFASIGVMESQYRIASGLSNFNISLSPQNLFSCGGGGCEFGWFPNLAAKFLQKTGVTDEACQPYKSGATGEDIACNAACGDADHRRYKIANYASPTNLYKDVDAVKLALQKGPLVTTLRVYMDFLAYSSGVYKHVSGDMAGGHAVSIVGYDDDLQAFIIRNSWGPDWGEAGFAHVSYDDVSGIGNETWSFDVNIGGAVSLESPRDYTYVTKSVDVKAESTYNGTDLQTITIYDAQSKPVYSGSCAAVCAQTVSVAGLADGRYEVQVTAMNSHGATLGSSPRQQIFVANAQPQLSLSFKGKEGTDLSQPLSGRPEFLISAKSSSVNMSALEFHILPAGGKETVRHSPIVLEDMTMGWRTTTIPNGQYEIWMVGHVTTNQFDVVTSSPHVTVQVKN